MRTLKWKGLWYKSVPEMTDYDDEFENSSGMCSGCAFEHKECQPMREAMEVDCSEDYEYDPEGINGVIYVPIEVKDIPIVAKQESILQGETND